LLRKRKGEILKRTEILAELKEALADYKEEGVVLKWHEDVLLNVLKSLDDVLYSLKRELTKREKKLFMCMLEEFGGGSSDVPFGKALELGYGSRIPILIKKLTPRWKRWFSGSIGFCISCLIIGLLTKWLLHSFYAGVFTALISRVLHAFIKYIPATYFQNELLIRCLNSSKKKRQIDRESSIDL
jgi:hypothetical protein